MIYADYNATTPCDRSIAQRMMEIACDDFANPSNRASLSGRRARGFIDTAREQVATTIGATPDEVFFTSGATEAANTIIFGVMQRLIQDRPRILTSEIEHPAICMPADHCARAGADWKEIPVDDQGLIDLEALNSFLQAPTALVCVMAANNETGVLQPIPGVVKQAHAAGALVFCDMTQMPGKLPFNVHTLGVDFACFSAHKCYGPKGVGAFYKRRGLALDPLIFGGGQEQQLRSGTENVPGIVGFGMAMDQAGREVHQRKAKLERLTRQLESQVRSHLPNVVIQSGKADRLPGTSMFSLPGIRGKWLAQCPGIVASSGSACASLQGKPSHVLRAMGVEEDTAMRSIRISLGMPTKECEVREIAQTLIKGGQRLLS